MNKIRQVNNLALMESDCILRDSFISLIYNISKIKQSNFPLHFRRTSKQLEILSARLRLSFTCLANKCSCVYQCVGEGAGMCIRHSLPHVNNT